MLLGHHDDAKREFNHGAGSKTGTFSDMLMAEAKEKSRASISIKDDGKQTFPFAKN